MATIALPLGGVGGLNGEHRTQPWARERALRLCYLLVLLLLDTMLYFLFCFLLSSSQPETQIPPILCFP